MAPHKASPYDHDHENEVALFAQTNFRNQQRKFGIKTDDRRRHMYVIGKTGMGKTTFLEQMVLSDIKAGHGLAYIDPHGDTAEKLLDFIPPHRINDVVYFNPADMEFPVGFNILEIQDENQKHLVAAGLMGVFKKIWPDVWSSRMEYILLNTIMALLDYPGSTLLGINRLLSDEEYRLKVISLIQDPVVKTFWVKEFAAFSEKYRTEAVAPLQNKVGQFLSATIIRNIVAQVKSTIDVREIMDSRKIFIVNLSKGRIGEENSRLLGAMIITRIQLAAMERVDMPERDRQDFYLYVDEFQNFATESFANILSEARKYRLNLVVAHQYIEQLDEKVRAAIFGNVGTLVSMRVGAADATFMEAEFTPRFTPEDLVNLKKYEIYLKLMIDGASSEPFSATTLPPIDQRTESTDKVIKVSRERYATPRKTIEEKVIKWAGYGTADTGQTIRTEDEIDAAADDTDKEIEERIKVLQATSPDVGEMAQPSDGGGFGKKKPKKALFQIPCAFCGKLQDLTFEPDWTKPWLCKEHLEMKKAGTLPRGPKLRPASDFKPGPDGTMPAASMGASAGAPFPSAPPHVAPAPTEPASRPAPAPVAPAARPAAPAPAPRPAAQVLTPMPTVKPVSLASLVGVTTKPDVNEPVRNVPATKMGTVPVNSKVENGSGRPKDGASGQRSQERVPGDRRGPSGTSASGAGQRVRERAPGDASRSGTGDRRGQSKGSDKPPRGPAPPPGSKIVDGTDIAMQTHKPRIVISGGEDEESDVKLMPKKEDRPASARTPSIAGAPEGLDASPSDASGTNPIQPGQVIKF